MNHMKNDFNDKIRFLRSFILEECRWSNNSSCLQSVRVNCKWELKYQNISRNNSYEKFFLSIFIEQVYIKWENDKQLNLWIANSRIALPSILFSDEEFHICKIKIIKLFNVFPIYILHSGVEVCSFRS